MTQKGYVKLFEKILDSTIWLQDDQTRIVWITLLAMCGEDGVVDAPIPAIAARARVKLEDCEKAMKAFQEPDPYSRTREHEGRRVEQRDGAWVILNHGKYRWMMSLEDRREYKRLKQQEYRDRDRKKQPTAETPKPAPKPAPLPIIPQSLVRPDFMEAFGKWQKYRSEMHKPMTPTGRDQLIKRFESIGPDRSIAAINHSIEKGWQGVFEPSDSSGRNNPGQNLSPTLADKMLEEAINMKIPEVP